MSHRRRDAFDIWLELVATLLVRPVIRFGRDVVRFVRSRRGKTPPRKRRR